MVDKLMYCTCTTPLMIHKITPYIDYLLWLIRLDTQLNVPTNQGSLNPQSC